MMEENKKPKSMLYSFIEYFYGNFVVLLLGFVSLPLITRVMTTDEYGRTAMFSSAVSIIYICAMLGLDQSYIRYFYKEGIDRRKLLISCLKYPFFLIIGLTFIYVLFSGFFNDFLFGRSGFDITCLVVVFTIASVFERFLFLNIRMSQNGRLYSNINIISKVLYILLIFVFVRFFGNDFRVVLYSMTLPMTSITIILGIAFYREGVKAKRDGIPEGKGIRSLELLRYGVPFVPMLIMEWLLSSMDKWSIKIFNDYSETGVYSAAMQIMSVLLTLKATYVAFWAPIAMERYERGKNASIREAKEPKEQKEVLKGDKKESIEDQNKAFFRGVFSKVQFLCIGAAFGITIFRGVIVLILGEDYRGAIRIIPFLTLMPILSILFEMTGQGIKFTGKIIYFNYASFAAIVINLVGNTLLVPHLKGIGAAIATALTYVIYFFIGTYYSKKCYPVDYDYKRLIISLVLYSGYAAYVTFFDNNVFVSGGIGFLLLFVHIAINYKTVWEILLYLFSLLKKGGGRDQNK